MTSHPVISHEDWTKASLALLAREKEFTRLRDELARERRALPWERVDKAYLFDAPEGRVTLADLFGGHGQLIVNHFMFGPDWNGGCPSCSFWSDNYNGIDVHLAQRDTALVAISRGPLAKLEAYKKRLGWTFRWVSSGGSDFNYDYGVSSRPRRGGTTLADGLGEAARQILSEGAWTMIHTATWHGKVIASSDNTLEVGGYRYFPRDTVKMSLLKITPNTASDLECPHGVQFYDVTDGKASSARAAWSYLSPQPKMKPVDHWIGFWEDVEIK